VLHRSEEIEDEECNLEFALVTVVGGCRPSVSIANVRNWLFTQFSIPGDNVRITRFHPKDFLIVFSFYDDMLHVLQEPPSPSAPFVLVFKQWHW
jgi:hypothetical protein